MINSLNAAPTEESGDTNMLYKLLVVVALGFIGFLFIKSSLHPRNPCNLLYYRETEMVRMVIKKNFFRN